MSKQATTEQIEQVPTNGGRQCSGCHRRNADLTLFENSKLYCTSCSGNVVRLGIAPVARGDEVAPAAEPSAEDDDDTEREEERTMASEPVQPEAIAMVPSLVPSSVETPSAVPAASVAPAASAAPAASVATAAHSVGPAASAAPAVSADVSLHGVLAAERVRLLEQRGELKRQFLSDVEAIDMRLAHVESLLDDQPESRAS